ncbi:hypothetical protein CW357_16675 [Rummeliibacillus sp. TYF005]|uniref:YncE family protein n=1 Tax=Rummeliibacillus sp. TYF005 TaxID=2058214 RepID=UPI000F5319AB|nr:hypothetical protein [Rummeliibacillus sp. TYF005]RPJ94208.1 hypothetical protein CW357_16675 [Rummeliibacillus sp. TYF005]
MKKRKRLLISISFMIVVIIAITISQRVILHLAYSFPTHAKDQKLVKNMPAKSESLNTNGKYLIAFSELGNTSSKKSGTIYVMDKNGNFISQSKKLNMLEPIGMVNNGKKAYVVSNRSAGRYQIDLHSGKIESINTTNLNTSHSFSLYSNKSYVIYDVANNLDEGQTLVYWKVNKPHKKETLVIPHGFVHAIYIEKDIAYITTEDPDAVVYIHRCNLRTGKVLSTKKLHSLDEQHNRSGLPSNPSMILYNDNLYYAISGGHNSNKENGKILVINPKSLNAIKKINIPDKYFRPDSFDIVDGRLVILDDYNYAYKMDRKGHFEKLKFNMTKKQRDFLSNNITFTEGIEVKNHIAYIQTTYRVRDEEKDKTRGEINAFDLKTGKHLSRTIIKRPLSNYLINTFTVLDY